MKKGFTLLELLVAIASGVVILFGALNLFSIARVAITASGIRSELAQNGRVAMERMSRDIRQAETLVTNIPDIGTDPLHPPTSELAFQDGHDPEALTYIRYYLSSQTLYREISFYSFSSAPVEHVMFNARNEFNELPTKTITANEIVAERVQTIQFYGDELINIQITLSNNGEKIIIPTTIFGRNTSGT